MDYIFLAVIPGIILLFYFYKRDIYEPEPKYLVLKTFFWGMLVAFITGLISNNFSKIFQINEYYSIVILAPIVEECFKFFAVLKLRFNHKEFNEPMDGIIYGVALALGFAVLENILYMYVALEQGKVFSTLLMRGFLSVPGHALYAVIWGYALGMYKFRKKSKFFLIISLTLAILCHACFNFFSQGRNIILVLLLLILLSFFMWKIANNDIKKALKNSPFIKYFNK